jgi:hypothetical protein
LKARRKSGYVTFALFLICPLLYLVLNPAAIEPSQYVLMSYWQQFSTLNKTVLGLTAPKSQLEMDLNVVRVFHSTAGVMFMRFVAFAYTYHYLNWFSKTSIIKWHEVSRPRLGLLAVVWLGCIGAYAYNYSLGFQLLFCLSYVHVFMEFPLNHMSIIGTARELPAALRSGSSASR